jgi:hypothetical protein
VGGERGRREERGGEKGEEQREEEGRAPFSAGGSVRLLLFTSVDERRNESRSARCEQQKKGKKVLCPPFPSPLPPPARVRTPTLHSVVLPKLTRQTSGQERRRSGKEGPRRKGRKRRKGSGRGGSDGLQRPLEVRLAAYYLFRLVLSCGTKENAVERASSRRRRQRKGRERCGRRKELN